VFTPETKRQQVRAHVIAKETKPQTVHSAINATPRAAPSQTRRGRDHPSKNTIGNDGIVLIEPFHNRVGERFDLPAEQMIEYYSR
jgi:hypothetical protein